MDTDIRIETFRVDNESHAGARAGFVILLSPKAYATLEELAKTGPQQTICECAADCLTSLFTIYGLSVSYVDEGSRLVKQLG